LLRQNGPRTSNPFAKRVYVTRAGGVVRIPNPLLTERVNEEHPIKKMGIITSQLTAANFRASRDSLLVAWDV
jgi:hypothetical protein